MTSRLLHRLALGLFLLGGLILVAPSAGAQTPPSIEEVRAQTNKYIKALEAKGERMQVGNAKRILRYLKDKSTAMAARGMFVGYKRMWDKKLGWEERKQDKKRRAMLGELGKGDKIVTGSGIHCEIVSVHAEDNTVTVKFGNDAGQRFKLDQRAYLDEWRLSEEQKQAVLDRNYNQMIALGGNIYFLAKIFSSDGQSFEQAAASMTGMSREDYRNMMLSGGRSPLAA